MKEIRCTVNSVIGPEFQEAYETFLQTGGDVPGFAQHIMDMPQRVEEVVQGAEWRASQHEEAGQADIAREIRAALIPLNIGLLGEAIAKGRQQLKPVTVECVYCSDSAIFLPGHQTGECMGCGNTIDIHGKIISAG